MRSFCGRSNSIISKCHNCSNGVRLHLFHAYISAHTTIEHDFFKQPCIWAKIRFRERGLSVEVTGVQNHPLPFRNFRNFVHPTMPVSSGRDSRNHWSLLPGSMPVEVRYYCYYYYCIVWFICIIVCTPLECIFM